MRHERTNDVSVMSKTASVSFRERNLWAYDVSLSILLAELINVITDLDPGQCPRWLKIFNVGGYRAGGGRPRSAMPGS
jgi:hypothetical protein